MAGSLAAGRKTAVNGVYEQRSDAAVWALSYPGGSVAADPGVGTRRGGDEVALALYRKYRPRTFAEVIGQEQVTEPMSQALRTGRLNHAYLFSGPRGCGKTSSAR